MAAVSLAAVLAAVAWFLGETSALASELDPPLGLLREETPQFVMLTYDDALNLGNINTYRQILDGKRRNKANNCTIAATFFVSHDYTDYQLVHRMYSKGSEIAVHSISHKPNTEYWKAANLSQWEKEIEGMRTILNKFAGIPRKEVKGHRAPFLQTAGNTTVEMLQNTGFLYDSSYPTRSKIAPPLWPYKLDEGFKQDCLIRPCPTGPYPDVWIIPLVGWTREPVKEENEAPITCSMADACLPFPENANDTFDYFAHNFERHYLTNRAPFPVFLHEAWLRQPERLKGYLEFLDYILELDDVFVVTVSEVIDFMEDPAKASLYAQRSCKKHQPAARCQKASCHYKKTNLGSERFIKVCTPCPPQFPWVGNPHGSG